MDMVHLNVSELSRMLNQVGDQLVTLSLGKINERILSYKTWHRIQFSLPRMMPKLKKSQMMVDIFECTDILKDIEKMPVLKMLELGKSTATKSTCLNEILQTICNSGKILGSVRSLTILQMHDATLLKGLKTAFPNLESLAVKTFGKMGEAGAVSGMELGVVLKGCTGGWERLKHLSLMLPKYSTKKVDVVKALLDSKDLYQGLTTFKVWGIRSSPHDLMEDEMDLFKQLLIAMDVMDKVTIWNMKFSKESVKNILGFMTWNKLSVSKFRMFGTCRRLIKATV
ncbi:uncharacterized protein LOC110855286 isoform X1 [Folsomia candida]|uniref:uncharacterized protein LOC110855286 isoform X1 n=2 Tax=Folsomia candida TaxID=158441 RepID=UPI0016052F28|nr:uncharacterized protein LOC110855286 isoform X1 [Folsomia candida]XP_035711844.1 uncharacterized protein LOC110855286 isoform X1 [Folsomia candida]